MSCPTSADGPFFGLIAPSTVECSGQGICINSTEYSAHFSSLCVCDDLYSGESDMFDLRVARLPNGTWLSLDCPNPRIGVWTVFSAQLIFLFMRQVLNMVALAKQFRFKKWMKVKDAFEYMPYRVLIIEVFIAGPILLGLPIQKLLPDGFVIGTDVGPTLCLVVGTFLGAYAYNDFEFAQFLALVKASSMEFEQHRRLIRRQKLVVWATRLSYWGFAVVPSLVALGLDKSLGPIRNGEYLTLIMRNIGIIIWMASQWLADVFMQHEIRIIVHSLMQIQGGDTLGTTALLGYLNQHAAKTKSTAIVGGFIWLFFSIPVRLLLFQLARVNTNTRFQYFWPFQGYAMTIVTCVTVFRTANVGLVLLHSARIQKKSELQSAMKSANSTNSHQLAPTPVGGNKVACEPNGSDLGQPHKDADGKTDQFESGLLNKTRSDLGLATGAESPKDSNNPLFYGHKHLETLDSEEKKQERELYDDPFRVDNSSESILATPRVINTTGPRLM